MYKPENVGMGESVHELNLSQHVGTITAQRVHLQSHDLACSSMTYLQHTDSCCVIQGLLKYKPKKCVNGIYVHIIHLKLNKDNATASCESYGSRGTMILD